MYVLTQEGVLKVKASAVNQRIQEADVDGILLLELLDEFK